MFVFALLLLNQVSLAARWGPAYRQMPPFGKRGSIRGRFLKVCNNCRLSPEQIFILILFFDSNSKGLFSLIGFNY